MKNINRDLILFWGTGVFWYYAFVITVQHDVTIELILLYCSQFK